MNDMTLVDVTVVVFITLFVMRGTVALTNDIFKYFGLDREMEDEDDVD